MGPPGWGLRSRLAASLLNVGQQVGGSMGLALLGTVAATTTKHQLQNVRPTHELVNRAIVAGYSSALELGVVIALIGFVIALLVIRSGKVLAEAEVVLATRSAAA